MARQLQGLLALTVFSLSIPALARGQELLYGGNGGHNDGTSINDGSLVTVDPVTAAVTVIGHPEGVDRLTGIAFDSSGTLYASTLTGGGSPPPPPPLTSTLITIDPDTGALLSTIGAISDVPGGPPMPISISDIAFQPGTGVLFAIRSHVDGLSRQGRLYTINTASGLATLVGDTGAYFATIAFAPDGTLYEAAASFAGGPVNPTIRTLNPANGAVLTSVATTEFFGALAVRSDGTLFGGTGDEHHIDIVDPATGAVTEGGDTGQNFIGALTFHSFPSGPCVPEDHTLCLNNGRFATSARWRTIDGRNGQGTGVKLTGESGYFWFFSPANIEIVTKVLNGCFAPFNSYWVFTAGLTDVDVVLTVTDTHTGNRRTYINPLGTPFAPAQDTNAFATCP